jgi:hypothetical protein
MVALLDATQGAIGKDRPEMGGAGGIAKHPFLRRFATVMSGPLRIEDGAP